VARLTDVMVYRGRADTTERLLAGNRVGLPGWSPARMGPQAVRLVRDQSTAVYRAPVGALVRC